jgi:PIN domain nuclease of toxin-antitoxin system
MVLDSKALLILFRGEPNHERVAQALEQPCCITTVSLAVLMVALSGVSTRALIDDLERLGVNIIPIDSSLALASVNVLTSGLKTEPAFALALAHLSGLEVLLGERISVPSGLKIKVGFIQ